VGRSPAKVSDDGVEQADAADEAQGGTRTASRGAALCPRRRDERGHRFAADPRCSMDSMEGKAGRTVRPGISRLHVCQEPWHCTSESRCWSGVGYDDEVARHGSASPAGADSFQLSGLRTASLFREAVGALLGRRSDLGSCVLER